MPFPLAEWLQYPSLADEHHSFEQSGPAPRFVSNLTDSDVLANEQDPSKHQSDEAYTMEGVNLNAIQEAANGDELELARIYKTDKSCSQCQGSSA